MRVLFLIDRLGQGGKERQLIELLKGFRRREEVQYKLLVLANKDEMQTGNHYPAAETADGNVEFIRRIRQKDICAFFRVLKVCREFRPDIIHSWELMCSVYAAPIARMLGMKFINGVIRNSPAHIVRFGKTWVRTRLTFPFSDVILANSLAGLRAYRTSAKKSWCIYNGFDFSRVRDLEDKEIVRRRFDIRTDKVVGMVGAFSEKKDYATYLQAALNIVAGRKDVTFVAVGDGPELARCRTLVGDRHQDQIKFLGLQQNVESIVNLFDVGVLATYTEGISNSIMEYMAVAKPVVATRGGGTEEIVRDNETGFIVPGGDVRALEERIQNLLNNPRLATQMGEAGRIRLEQQFSLETMVRRFAELYQRCVSL